MKTGLEIYEMLNKEIPEGYGFVPNKIFDMKLHVEELGFFCVVIAEAFDQMRQSLGKSNWEVDCSFLKKKERGKSRTTPNNIRKFLLSGTQKKIIKSVREEKLKIIATINIEFLMQDENEVK